MQAKVYVFQIRRLLTPALLFLLLYPALLALFCFLSKLPARYGQIFTLIYIVTFIVLVVIIVLAYSQKLLIDEDTLVFSSLLTRETLEPGDIKRITFSRPRRREEIVRIRAGGKTYLLSDFYFPFNELLIDLEEWIRRHQVNTLRANYRN
ncbi:MAG: hypothetical protein LBH21_08145 [Gracilibacteraceae bacterium]|jgi:hypothetical protein|nr:hypothetical protein [Gracilibacteraceae bacterium]